MSMTPKPAIEAITFTYREIVVTYDAANDWFMCDLFKRGAATPKSARERIDELLKQKLKPEAKFERFQAWHKGYGFGSTYSQVTVTSLAEEGEAWITHGTSRQKARRGSLFPVNPHNDKLIAELLANEAAIENLRSEASQLASKLTRIP